jgi:hypothetical protein
LGQIYDILWDYALFCSVNELRRIAIEQPTGGVGFNEPVMRLFDAGFATTQAIAIRRLIEKPKHSPNLAVISLRCVLKDIRDNIDIITRENYICYDGFPYDYETARNAWQSRLVSGGKHVRVGTLNASGPDAWSMSMLAHENFDKLAQVASKDRKRTDLIKIKAIEFLEDKLDECRDVKTYVDKFIAHNAAPATRSDLSDSQKVLTLERLQVCHKVIYQVASFILARLLWESTPGGVPVPQHDHLANLNESWATKASLQKARSKWEEFVDDVIKWDSSSFWPSSP